MYVRSRIFRRIQSLSDVLYRTNYRVTYRPSIKDIASMLPMSTAQYYTACNWTSYSFCNQNRMCSYHAGQTTGPSWLTSHCSRDSISVVLRLSHCSPDCASFPSTAMLLPPSVTTNARTQDVLWEFWTFTYVLVPEFRLIGHFFADVNTSIWT